MTTMLWVSSLLCGVIGRFITQCESSVELLDLKSSRYDYRLSCVRSSHMSFACACLLQPLARCISGESSYVTYNFKCVKAFSHSSHECVSKTRVHLTHNVKVQLLAVDHSASRSMKNGASCVKRCELQDTPST